ncbi:MAG: PepSY domain-containing protein, partial [Bauldia sp.]
QPVKVLDREGKLVEQGRISKILAFRGIERVPIDEAEAGDIVTIAGLPEFNVADTLCAPDIAEPLQAQPIDPPTLSMTFTVNDSPLAGTEGDKVQSRVIRERLMREAEGNVALHVEAAPNSDAYVVSGRGELQLAILIETMRREGFELSVSRPKVVFRVDPATGRVLEPIEEVVIDVDDEHSGIVIDKLSQRRAEMVEMRPSGGGRLRLVFAPQITAWSRPELFKATPGDKSPQAMVDTAIARFEGQDAAIDTISFPADNRGVYVLQLTVKQRATAEQLAAGAKLNLPSRSWLVYLDPGTGKINGARPEASGFIYWCKRGHYVLWQDKGLLGIDGDDFAGLVALT